MLSRIGPLSKIIGASRREGYEDSNTYGHFSGNHHWVPSWHERDIVAAGHSWWRFGWIGDFLYCSNQPYSCHANDARTQDRALTPSQSKNRFCRLLFADTNIPSRGRWMRSRYGILEKAVKAAGGTLKDIVKTTTYVVGADTGAKIRPARQELLPAEGRPTSTTVIVAGLADPDFLVEVEAIAVIGDG